MIGGFGLRRQPIHEGDRLRKVRERELLLDRVAIERPAAESSSSAARRRRATVSHRCLRYALRSSARGSRRAATRAASTCVERLLLHLDRATAFGRARERAAGDRPMIRALGACSASSAAACSPATRASAAAAPSLQPPCRASRCRTIAVVRALRVRDPLPVPLSCRDDVIHSAPKRAGSRRQQWITGCRASRRRPAARSAARAGRRFDNGRSRTSGSAARRMRRSPAARHGDAGRKPTRAPRKPAVEARGTSSHAASSRSRTPADSGPLVEAGVLDRRADQQRTVVPRHEIATLGPGDAAQRRPGPGEVQQLTANRPNGHAPGHALDLDRHSTSCRRRARRRRTSSDPRSVSTIDVAVAARKCAARGSARSAARRGAAPPLASARVRSRAATKPCDGISRPPIDAVARCGSSASARRRRRACPPGHRGERARPRSRAIAGSSRLVGRDVSVPVRRYGTAMPLSATMRAMKSSYSSRLRTARSSSGLLRPPPR